MQTIQWKVAPAMVAVALFFGTAGMNCVGFDPYRCTNDRNTLQTDPKNCGICGFQCLANEVCMAGKCVDAPPTVCEAPSTGCHGECKNLQSDPKNCGFCDEACDEWLVCHAGTCRCPDGEGTSCGEKCVNTKTDTAHCGGCDQACAAGQQCSDGKCVPRVHCEAHENRCYHKETGFYCSDLSTDPKNCGKCGRKCSGRDPICANGICTHL